MVENFEQIIGNDYIVKYMKNALESRKIANAYLISGESGIGKSKIVNIFVMALLCEDTTRLNISNACGKCKSCRQISTGNHPDVITLVAEKEKISVKEVRTQINNTIDIKPYSANKKVYIIPNADKMNEESQNALLKTIEEPPEYGVIILESSNLGKMLITIQSRCVKLNMKAVSESSAINYLKQNENVTDYEAQICAAFAQGNLGKAVKLVNSGEFIEVKKSIINMLSNIRNTNTSEFLEYAKEIYKYKEQIEVILELMQMWIRDLLVYKTTGNVTNIIFKENITDIKRVTRDITFEGIEKIIIEIEETKARLKANVNLEMCLELLLRALKES